ncbi:hypothetical protein [Erwinia sp. E_sp_B01_9]|uniref:hypothetical protein n=1 Tax=Erwinia sp. E_sp_B01_9 TaxID=3039403 RepID=UPI003D9BD44F
MGASTRNVAPPPATDAGHYEMQPLDRLNVTLPTLTDGWLAQDIRDGLASLHAQPGR